MENGLTASSAENGESPKMSTTWLEKLLKTRIPTWIKKQDMETILMPNSWRIGNSGEDA